MLKIIINSQTNIDIYPYGVYNKPTKVRQQDIEERTKLRSSDEYKKLMNRLNRIEGQIRGVKGMLEKDAYCTDIVLQVSAINAALNSFNKMLLAEHIRTCVAEDIRAGREDTLEDLVNTITRLMK